MGCIGFVNMKLECLEHVACLKRLKDGEAGFKGHWSDHFGLEVFSCVNKIGNCGIFV